MESIGEGLSYTGCVERSVKNYPRMAETEKHVVA
jgi:hypothetical protein